MKSIRFKEAATLLLIMLIILGTAVIRFGLSPQIPVLFVIALLIFWVKIRGASYRNDPHLYRYPYWRINRCLDSSWSHPYNYDCRLQTD